MEWERARNGAQRGIYLRLTSIGVQLGRVLNVEHHLIGAYALQATRPMRAQQRVPIGLVVAQEAVGRLRFDLPATDVGKALGGLPLSRSASSTARASRRTSPRSMALNPSF